MTRDQIAYTLDNTWEKAHHRLTLLESIYDPGTISRLTALGVGAGWRCLEVGAGAGSITRWICDRVGPDGLVAAVDLEPLFLERDPRPNLEIHRRDILTEGFPGDGYDLIHARALFMHLPDRDALIADLAGHLRPGGVILLEEGDCFPSRPAAPLSSARCGATSAQWWSGWGATGTGPGTCPPSCRRPESPMSRRSSKARSSGAGRPGPN